MRLPMKRLSLLCVLVCVCLSGCNVPVVPLVDNDETAYPAEPPIMPTLPGDVGPEMLAMR